MIFLTKILAMAAATSPINTTETENITTHQQEEKGVFKTEGWNKEQIIKKIEELRVEIEKINLHRQTLKFNKIDFSEQEDTIADLKEGVGKQKYAIKRLSNLIEENAQAIKNKRELFNNLTERSESLEAKIKLKKEEMDKMTDTSIPIDHQLIIQSKQEEKKSILFKMRIINKKIRNLKMQINEKTFEIIGLQIKFNKSVSALEHINSAITKYSSSKREVLAIMNGFLSETLEEVRSYNSLLMTAKKERIQLENELEQFWTSDALKKIEYKHQLKVIKKEIQEFEKQLKSNIADVDNNKVSKTDELLEVSENIHNAMLKDLKTQQEEIALYEEKNDKLKVTFNKYNKKLKKLKQGVKDRAKQFGTREESELKNSVIDYEIESSKNARNHMIQEQNRLKNELVQFVSINL